MSSTTAVGPCLEQQPWLCCTAHPVLKHSKSLPAWEKPWQLIPARQFHRDSSQHTLEHEVWKVSLELNVPLGLSQPKLFWDCDSMIKICSTHSLVPLLLINHSLHMTFDIKFHRGLSAWLSGWIMGLFITFTLHFQGGLGAVGRSRRCTKNQPRCFGYLAHSR